MQLELNYKAKDGQYYEVSYFHEPCEYGLDEIDPEFLTIYNEVGLEMSENDKVYQEIKNYLFDRLFIYEDVYDYCG